MWRTLRHALPYTGTIAPRVTAFSGDARNRIVAATSSTFGQLAKSAFGIDARFAGEQSREPPAAGKGGGVITSSGRNRSSS